METITTLKELIDRITRRAPKESIFSIMINIDIPESEFEPYYSWNAEKYTRNVLARTPNCELMLICWENGQESTIHDYDKIEAWVHPISGKLKEERFRLASDKKLEKIGSSILRKDDYHYLDKPIIHKFTNVNEGRSVSLHLYAEPVDKWTIYELDGSSKKIITEYDTVMGKKVDHI